MIKTVLSVVLLISKFIYEQGFLGKNIFFNGICMGGKP